VSFIKRGPGPDVIPGTLRQGRSPNICCGICEHRMHCDEKSAAHQRCVCSRPLRLAERRVAVMRTFCCIVRKLHLGCPIAPRGCVRTTANALALPETLAMNRQRLQQPTPCVAAAVCERSCFSEGEGVGEYFLPQDPGDWDSMHLCLAITLMNTALHALSHAGAGAAADGTRPGEPAANGSSDVSFRSRRTHHSRCRRLELGDRRLDTPWP
jgi:hypothetical protein